MAQRKRGAAGRRRHGQRQRLGDHAPRGGAARRVRHRRTRRASCRRTGCPTTCSSTPRMPRRAACAASSPAPAARRTCPACWPRRPPCRCSACRSRRSTCAARIRCYSIVQMPKGIPVATFAIGEAGAANAGIVRRRDARRAPMPALAKRLAAFRAKQTDAARAMRVPPASLTSTAWRRPATFRPAHGSGLLGGGQLGRMFCMAAQSLGYKVAVLDPGERQPGRQRRRPAHSRRLPRSARPRASSRRSCRAATTEFENVPAAALEFLARDARVTPAAASVAIAQDRIREKTFLAGHGFDVAPFAVLRSDDDARGVDRRTRCRASSRARAWATTARDRFACATRD